MPQPGVNTPHDGLSTKSKTQLLDEALNYVDEVAQLVGGEWLDAGVPPTVFSLEDREGWSWLSCDHRATTGQYDVNVRQLAGPSSEFDPDALSAKVRSYWEGLGYRVRQIGPAAQDSGGHRSIIVDLPHSASISFSANTEILGISASGECTKWD
ncbi:hypothetical protein [Leifsonia sp. 1010]|uniref:hypothetical protein n=1 Tax=Leifsonia sp. 1010 TaxID=2817769 RepID=UPI0028631493|nr:hypothetical protein [Leifsonia sp. 1010]MDR6611445.1 hypothetical protein [Leifsonia sp. 1010]